MINYIKYIKNNPKGYWFKRKLYGWGWVPSRWQGWLVLLIWAILFTLSLVMIEENDHEIGKNFAVIITVILIWICYKKGEKPRWSWGK
ncbi:MAG: hypothetical protein NT076_01035 [Candidatus Pacearchaeota archaeon]|nr:hypothetical protein [Candidatus Pacearchaeota archaeon]